MTSREQLWYLINGLLAGKYRMDIFCDEFSRIYNIETDDNELSDSEHILFKEIGYMTSRFSNYEDDLKLNAFYTEAQVLEKVRDVKQKLG